jgi:hypothetical protein
MATPSAVDCTSFLISAAARSRAHSANRLPPRQDALHLDDVITASPIVGGTHWRADSAGRLPPRQDALHLDDVITAYRLSAARIGAHTPPAACPTAGRTSTWMSLRLLAVGISGDDPTLSEVSHRCSFCQALMHSMRSVALHRLFGGDFLKLAGGQRTLEPRIPYTHTIPVYMFKSYADFMSG